MITPLISLTMGDMFDRVTRLLGSLTVTVEDASTWEINDVVIKTPGVEGETSNRELFYNFTDGSWTEAEGVYFIDDADFSSMGLTNFGSSIPADNYLPTFLDIKFPYAQEDESLTVVYDYVSS